MEICLYEAWFRPFDMEKNYTPLMELKTIMKMLQVSKFLI